MVREIFDIDLHFRHRHVFMWKSVGILNVFNTLSLKQIFWKMVLEYHFLVESTKIENTSFPYKTATSEASIKTNRMVSTKWTKQKEWRFASNYFFLKNNFFCFSLGTSHKKLIWCTKDSNAHLCTFCKWWSFIWGGFFPVPLDTERKLNVNKTFRRKKRLKHKCFYKKLPKFLRTPFLREHLRWLLLTYDKSVLVLVIISFV